MTGDNFRNRLMFLFLAIGFLGLALMMTPERLIPLGIMDLSLQSNNELTRQTTLFEVAAAKYIGFAFVAIFLVLFFTMPTIKRSAPYQAFMARDLDYPKAYETGLTRVFDKAFVCMIIMLFLSICYFVFAEAVFSPQMRGQIQREDGVIEYTSAVLLLIAGGYGFYVALFARHIRLAPRLFHLFLALLFVAMWGEEISWGQRILGYGTPDSLSNLNVQNEVNLHNMFGYLFDHLFILGFFIWGCVLPFMFHFSPLNAQVLRWTGLPLPSIGLAIAMLLVTLYQDKVVYQFVDPIRGFRIPEMRELLSAIAFLLMMMQSKAGLVSRRDAH